MWYSFTPDPRPCQGQTVGKPILRHKGTHISGSPLPPLPLRTRIGKEDQSEIAPVTATFLCRFSDPRAQFHEGERRRDSTPFRSSRRVRGNAHSLACFKVQSHFSLCGPPASQPVKQSVCSPSTSFTRDADAQGGGSLSLRVRVTVPHWSSS